MSMPHPSSSSSIALLRLMNSARDAAPMISLTNSSRVPPLSHVTVALLSPSLAQRPARRCVINSKGCGVTRRDNVCKLSVDFV